MTVDITQDEMNILNLNGISADEVKSNVEFMRASGYDDKTIRQSYDNTLNELRPITKVSVNDTQRINEYNKKGAITPYEFAQRKAVEYNGTYDNISKQKLTPRDISIQERIERDRQKKLERNKRVNEGTGSFFDRAGAFMDRMGDSAYQSEKQRAELNEHRQQPNKDNPNYRYEVSGVNRAGQPIYTEIDKTKKIDFKEALRESILTGSWTPYVGGFIEKGDEAKERDIRERILEGKEIRQDELNFLNYRLDRKNEERLRGYTIGGQIANSFLPSIFRLGAEIATGGWVLKSLGFGAELAEGASVGEKVAHGLKTMAGSGIMGAVLPTSWNETFANYQDIMENKTLVPTETGAWIFKESEEKPAISFLKSLGQTFSMFASEGSGELIGLGLKGMTGAASKYVGSPIGAYLMRNAKLNKLYNSVVPAMAKAYEKMNGLPVVGRNTDWLKKAVKYDGLLEEMGEEALEDVLNLTLGTKDEKRSLENYAKAIFKSPDEWAVIAGAVLLQGGVLSATSHMLGSALEKNGMSDDEIVETLNNLTPEEQREEVEKMIDEGIINLPEYKNENLEKVDKLKDNFYNQLKNAGMDDAESLSNADISADVIAKTAQDFGIDVDELNRQFGIDIQNMTDEEAYEQYQNDNVMTLQGRVEQNAYADSDEYWLDKAEEYEGVNEEDDLLFQNVNSAGADANNIADAQREWEEKGTDSKYFKAWFGDSKVVDENGKPLKLTDDKDIYITDGYSNSGISRYSYKGSHRAPSYAEGNVQDRIENSEDVNLEEVAQGFHNQPKDYFEPIGARYYNYDDVEGKESAAAVRNITKAINAGEKDITVTVYRAVPKDVGNTKLKNGDWVTLSKTYAKVHGETNLDDNYKVIAQEVPITDVWWDGNDIREWGYDNGKEQVPDLYLSIQNPKYQDNLPENWKDARKLRDEGYDGVITSDGKYLVFEKMQIKSDDNRGTFDSNSGNIYYQAAAMYKSPKEKFNDFYNQVFEKEKAAKANGTKVEKSYFEYSNNSVYVRVKHDAINHGENKHRLSVEEWENVLENITNIENADYSKKEFSNDKVALIKINTPMGKYGVTIQFANGTNQIATAFKSTDKGIDAWIKKGSANSSISEPLTSRDKTHTVAVVSQNPNNIIPQILEKITSNQANVTKHEDNNIQYQSMTKEQLLNVYMNQEFGMSADDITDMVTEDIKNILVDYDVSEDEFKFEDIRIYGSYSKGTNKQGSDLDIVVQYSGSLKEDSAFNMFHDEELSIYDKQGRKVKIDINPINTAVHGTIDDYSRILFQSAYHGTPHRFDNFSTDNIGTGEGAQAHGWGLYFAGDKNVSEKYRRKLSGNKVFYNGEELAQSYFYTHQWMQGKDVEENKYLSNLRSVIDDIGEIQASKKISLEEARQEFIKEYQSKKKLLAYQKKYLEIAKDIDTSKIDIQKGQLFEVDIPDSDVLLDEDKPFSEQPEKVQGAIAKLFNDLWNIDIYNSDKISSDFRKPYNELTGGQLYREIDNVPEMASKTLNKYGIKGITYDGIQDGRCYVIFDDKAVNVLKTYYQESEEGNTEPNSTQEGIANARGFTYETELADSVKNMIVLLKNKKDKSTYIHEFAHVYLNVLNRLAKTNSKAQDRLNTINKWLRYDGRGEYTTAQHEKFANGFVAYIKQGKAPTYGLKRAFEHFKKWLNDIYVALDNHSEFIMDSEAKAVFDEILGGTEHDKQLQNGIELYNRAISYAEVKKAEKNEKEIKQSQLSEYQRRYMNTAYDIIYYALQNNPEGKQLVKNRNQLIMILGTAKRKTGFQMKRKGIVSQFEQIENILQSLSDEFSSRDGFLPEWGEFFKPLSDEYTDSELALDALDTIVQERYLTKAFNDDFDDSRYGDFSDATVEETQNIFDYIVEEYRDAKDKTIPLLAWNEFHSHIHPYIIDDFEKKWESETAEIDRYQSLSKMQQAKEDLKLYAAALKGQGDYHKQFVEYATKILDKLDFMTTADKEKIIKKLGEFGTFRDIERNLDNVMDYAETLQAVTERRMIADSIQREVKQTIHEWKNGIKKTKYTYPANKLFERLRELNRMTQEQVQDIYDEFVNEESAPDYVSDDVNNEDYYKVIEKMFVQFKANGMYYNSTAFLQDLLDKIQSAKFTAKVARDEIDFERRMQQIHYVDKCAQALNNRKTEIKENNKIKFLSNLNAFGFNFNGALRMIFNDNIKNWASLDYLYARKDGQVGKDRREFLNKAKSIFGFEGKKGDIQLQSKFIDMTKKEFTITQRHSPDIEKGSYRVTENNKETGYNPSVQTQQVRLNQSSEIADEWKPIEVELSRMEVLYYYIQAKNPTSWAILTDDEKGQFKRADFENLLEELTPEEKLLGDLMQLSAEKYWDALNAYHIKKYHTELGKVKNYFPRLSESQEVNMLEMFNDFSQYSGTGKFQKQRTAGPGTRIASANALAVLFDHMERANTIVIMGEHLDLINKVFKNPDLKRLLENTWGEKVSQEFYGQLTGNLFTGQSAVKSLQEKWYQKVVGNLVKTNLFLKPQIGIKQLISFMNYGKGDDYVSAGEWLKAFAKQTFTPSEWKKNIEFMMSNDYMRDRFSRGGSMDALKKELENKFFAKINLFDEFWSLPIQLGDIGAIILGGKPYIDVLMNKGYSKEEAFKIFIETTVNDQQSSIPSTLSNAQRNASKQPFSKMFFAYQNTPWQYYRQCTSAIMNAVQSGKTKDIKRASKMVLLYGWIFPAIFNMASSLSPLALVAGGDDDDLLNDINPLRTLTSLLTQHPIVGDWINGILNAIDDKGFYSNDLLTKHVKSVNKLIRDTKKGELTLKDIWDATCAFVEPSTGLPVGSAGNAVSGVYDMTQGDFLKGALKAFGYSEYRAKSVTGEE